MISIETCKKLCTSQFYVGKRDWVKGTCKIKDGEECLHCFDSKSPENEVKAKDKLFEKIKLYLKNYLQLDNVTFLFGTGSTFYLNTNGIGAFPKDIENAVDGSDHSELFWKLMQNYKFNSLDGNATQMDETRNVPRWDDDHKEIIVPFEDFLNYLYCIKNYYESVSNLEDSENKIKNITSLIKFLKQELFKLCNIDGDPVFHKYFLKSLLTRPVNLKRANIFTTNYDLAFENAYDELGISYIDGFSGFHHRYFRPEVFEYDYFYPGSKTEGSVRKIERVVKYFKLHGSLTWVREKKSANNLYGLRERTCEYIQSNPDQAGDIMIYPTSLKKGYTLDFPYSELFRQFAQSITNQQSVLITVGYSFFDEHINDIIYQALAIPSFTLIIIAKRGINNNRPDSPLKRLFELGDSRVIILQGDFLGCFENFAEHIMPDFNEYEVRERVSEIMNKLHADSGSIQETEKLEQEPIKESLPASILVDKTQDDTEPAATTIQEEDAPF
ncbi:MAG: SIR2 family protein [Candidatus Stygibacter australis]|nr:SIR2 family protein [Candidatus Stygibacter australis]